MEKQYPKIKPVSDFVYVTKCKMKCIRDDCGKILIHMTDRTSELHNWAKIWDIGPKCKIFGRGAIGKYVLCPEIMTGMHRLEDEDWAVRETILDPFVLEITDGTD